MVEKCLADQTNCYAPDARLVCASHIWYLLNNLSACYENYTRSGTINGRPNKISDFFNSAVMPMITLAESKRGHPCSIDTFYRFIFGNYC